VVFVPTIVSKSVDFKNIAALSTAETCEAAKLLNNSIFIIGS
jgi:hypothetical protein